MACLAIRFPGRWHPKKESKLDRGLPQPELSHAPDVPHRRTPAKELGAGQLISIRARQETGARGGWEQASRPPIRYVSRPQSSAEPGQTHWNKNTTLIISPGWERFRGEGWQRSFWPNILSPCSPAENVYFALRIRPPSTRNRRFWYSRGQPSTTRKRNVWTKIFF